MKIKSFECPKLIKVYKRNNSWNIRHLVDGTFVPENQRTSEPAYYIVDCWIYGQPTTTHSFAALHCDWLNIWISGATVLCKKCKWSWLKPGRCVCLTTGEDWVELILLVHYVCARLGALYSVLVGAQSHYIEVARWGISIRTSPNLIFCSYKIENQSKTASMSFSRLD